MFFHRQGNSVTLTSSGGGTYRWLTAFVTSSNLTVAPISTTTCTVEVTDNGCKDTITQSNTVHPLPEPQFTTGNVCDGSITFFTNASTCPSPDIVQYWTWDFGDGSPFKNNSGTSHLYPATGTYTAELVSTTDFGCKDSIIRNIVVNPNPVVAFSAPDTTGCSPLCVSFPDQSSISSGTNISFVWNYGAGVNPENVSNGFNCYINNTGESGSPIALSFDVSLTVTSDSRCVSSDTKNNLYHSLSQPYR